MILLDFQDEEVDFEVDDPVADGTSVSVVHLQPEPEEKTTSTENSAPQSAIETISAQVKLSPNGYASESAVIDSKVSTDVNIWMGSHQQARLATIRESDDAWTRGLQAFQTHQVHKITLLCYNMKAEWYKEYTA